MSENRRWAPLADRIASSLFVNAFGSCGSRLVLLGAEGRDLGGWGHVGASNQIESILISDPLVAAAPDLARALEGLLRRHRAYIEALPGESGLADLAAADTALARAGRTAMSVGARGDR